MVNPDRLCVMLELEVAAEPIVGTVEANGRHFDFSGWVGLATALAQVISSAGDGGPARPVGSRSDGRRPLSGERARELGTRMDPELEVAVAQMALDRVDGDEQLLRDLPVREPGGGQTGHPPLAGRQ